MIISSYLSLVNPVNAADISISPMPLIPTPKLPLTVPFDRLISYAVDPLISISVIPSIMNMGAISSPTMLAIPILRASILILADVISPLSRVMSFMVNSARSKSTAPALTISPLTVRSLMPSISRAMASSSSMSRGMRSILSTANSSIEKTPT